MNVVGVCFWITTRCNLRCQICYADLNSAKDTDRTKCVRIIDKLRQLGVRKIAFTGGDPLLVKYITSLLKYAKSSGFKVALTTNAKLLSLERLHEIEPYLDELSVPLDGITSSTSELHRTAKHNQQNVLDLVKQSSTLSVKLDVSTVVTGLNIKELPLMLTFLIENKVRKWKLLQYSGLNRPSNSYANFYVSNSKVDSMLCEMNIQSLKVRCLIEVDVRYSDSESINSYVNILPNGDILLSKNDAYLIAGNIDDCASAADLNNLLLANGFSFEHHLARHFRDI